MKKIIIIGLIALMAVVFVFSSCASKGAATPPAVQKRSLPEFFLSPPSPEDQYVGLGLARMSDNSLSRAAALARARRDIATQISVKVQSMLTDYAQESGTTENTQLITFVEKVAKEVTDMELKGAVTKQQEMGNDGTWYVMVWYPKNALLQDVNQVFQRNEAAAFAEFKAQQALDRLNAELENDPPKSAGVDSPVNKE